MSKSEEVKVEGIKEEVKAEAVKAEEAKTETAKVETVKAEEAKIEKDENKSDEKKVEVKKEQEDNKAVSNDSKDSDKKEEKIENNTEVKKEDNTETKKTEDNKKEEKKTDKEDTKKTEDKKTDKNDDVVKVDYVEHAASVETDEEKEERLKKKKKFIIASACSAVATLAVVIGGLTYYVHSSSKYFDKGSKINNIDVGGMTVEEAKNTLVDFENNYKLSIVFNEGKKVINGSSMGFKVVDESNVDDCLEEQNKDTFFNKLLSKGKKKFDLEYSFEDQKLSKILAGMDELDTEKMVAPVDAHLEMEDGDFVIEKEILGNTMDITKATVAIDEAIREAKEEIDLNEFYEKPEVYSDNADLIKKKDNLNELIGVKITYKLPNDKEKVLDGKTLKKWLKKDESGNYYKNKKKWNKKLTEYVDKLASEVDTVYKEHLFKTHKGDVISLRAEGYYGYLIDKEKELAQLKKELKKGENVEREPLYVRKEAAPYDDNYGFGKNYIEISIEKQHMWIYKDGKVALETDVVTGKNDGKHETSKGAFYAFDKRTNKKLTGEIKNGRPEYIVWVKNWIRVTNYGIGIHETSYRNRFGGNIWRRNGSHGCINCPAKTMPKIYEIVETNMPIAIY